MWELFISFFKIGFFTFGGGLAMIPFIEDEFVRKKGWISEEEMADMVSLSQSFPGVIAINVSILVGQKRAGFWGSFLAAWGTILPALLSIVVAVALLQGFEENRYVKAVFVGIKAASAALILDTVIRMSKKQLQNKFGWGVALISTLIVVLGFSAAWSVVVGALAGLILLPRKKK